jgi:NAD(P)-dependent dehydrogenase (short-subunit alcohol dehydrogenase family)
MSRFAEISRLFGLAGKVAVVTGGASGIGKATARLLADAGAAIAILDQDIAGAAQLAAELPEAAAYAADIAEEAAVRAAFAAITARFGTVDILVNNAGIYPKYSFEALTEAQWQEMQRVNVWGNFVVMREAVRAMRGNGQGGRVINISSIGGARTAVNDQYAYNASKAALDAFTLSAALEFAADGILVNSILPGAVRPLDPKPKPAGHAPPLGPLMDAGRMLLGRPALADEIAGPILLLASPAGGYITGQCIVVDGGFSVS